jgi:hypothetical protein
VLSLVFLVPAVAAIYLARKLRTRPESNGRAAGSGGQNHDLAGVR